MSSGVQVFPPSGLQDRLCKHTLGLMVGHVGTKDLHVGRSQNFLQPIKSCWLFFQETLRDANPNSREYHVSDIFVH